MTAGAQSTIIRPDAAFATRPLPGIRATGKTVGYAGGVPSSGHDILRVGRTDMTSAECKRKVKRCCRTCGSWTMCFLGWGRCRSSHPDTYSDCHYISANKVCPGWIPRRKRPDINRVLLAGQGDDTICVPIYDDDSQLPHRRLRVAMGLPPDTPADIVVNEAVWRLERIGQMLQHVREWTLT